MRELLPRRLGPKLRTGLERTGLQLVSAGRTRSSAFKETGDDLEMCCAQRIPCRNGFKVRISGCAGQPHPDMELCVFKGPPIEVT